MKTRDDIVCKKKNNNNHQGATTPSQVELVKNILKNPFWQILNADIASDTPLVSPQMVNVINNFLKDYTYILFIIYSGSVQSTPVFFRCIDNFTQYVCIKDDLFISFYRHLFPNWISSGNFPARKKKTVFFSLADLTYFLWIFDFNIVLLYIPSDFAKSDSYILLRVVCRINVRCVFFLNRTSVLMLKTKYFHHGVFYISKVLRNVLFDLSPSYYIFLQRTQYTFNIISLNTTNTSSVLKEQEI